MKKKLIIIITIFVTIVGLLIIYLPIYQENKRIKDLEIKGYNIVQKVEEYKRKKHKIPQYMEDMKLNLPDNYLIYYNAQKDSTNYFVSFQIAPFRSMVYNSATKSWEYQ